ncbi:MAG: cytochrome c biogenesis protein DipZ [Acidobacteriota bacterium]|nr:cytochrome c biogenesis protein DipZ [Acidobacteriota bacterium]
MIGLLAVGLVAGLVAGISPCILPVLPVVLVAGTTGRGERARRRRPVAVVAGVVVSFSALILGGSALLSALHLPQDLLRDLGLAVLGLFGIGLLVPALGSVLERPFARLRVPDLLGRRAGFVLGLGLGAVFVPCAGPVLAAVTVVGATHDVSVTAVLLTLAFAVGAGVPLLAVALAGEALVHRARALQRRATALRRVGGAVLVTMTFLIGLDVTEGLQRAVPGYTTALQHGVEGTAFATRQLQALTGRRAGTLSACGTDPSAGLEDCGPAPALRGITAWLHTPGGRPLRLAALEGRVVLLDFWTYSCINCQRALPHLEAWAHRYGGDGLVVVGIHTPEFAFEHVVANVASASRELGVDYPVAVDDAYDTWNAYGNEYWPAEYLVDAKGEVRHVHFAEGEYAGTETLIRRLLVEARPGLVLPGTTGLPDRTPKRPTNPETYLGYARLQYLVGATPVPDTSASYRFPSSLPPGGYGLSGAWTIGAESAVAGDGARLELGFQADDVYLVLGGTGTVTVDVDGQRTRTVAVGGIPRLYTLLDSASLQSGTMTLGFTSGVVAYDFTFG